MLASMAATASPSVSASPSVIGRGRQHRAVVLHATGASHQHCLLTYEFVAQRLAEVLALPFEGRLDPERHGAGDCYVVPDETLCPPEAARALGIGEARDFFGGIVPFPFVATKCVSHGLVSPDASRPDGWVEGLAPTLDGLVLPGYTAFDLDDAVESVRRLVAQYGPVRIKPPSATGGGGQSVHAEVSDAEARLRELSSQTLAREGVVIEIDLDEAVTWSVGKVQVVDLDAAYYGTQRTTTNNHGNTVYGGSTLQVVRGGWDDLLARELPDGPREAVQLARRYHDAMRQAFPALVASRCNYDIISGRDAQGRPRSAVLEQSWRIGGASGAEIAALAAFCDDPSVHAIEASTHEVYGAQARSPAGAQVQFDGDDPDAGRILKYVCVNADDDR